MPQTESESILRTRMLDDLVKVRDILNLTPWIEEGEHESRLMKIAFMVEDIIFNLEKGDVGSSNVK